MNLPLNLILTCYYFETFVIVTELETKDYKVVFKKRRLMDNFDSLPYGF